jgi:hypothetical protein
MSYLIVRPYTGVTMGRTYTAGRALDCRQTTEVYMLAE